MVLKIDNHREPVAQKLRFYRKCPNPKCKRESRLKATSMKCRHCLRCFNCSKNLKKGGGRHKRCPICLKTCFDHRGNRLACQKCEPTRSRYKTIKNK